jgi:hypothetical protein
MYLTPDELRVAIYEDFLPQMAAEYTTQHSFDEETMAMGSNTVIYVQPVVELSQDVDVQKIRDRLASVGFAVNSQIFVFPDLVHKNVISLVVVERNVDSLVGVVYRLLTYIATEIVESELNGSEPICRYCRAIEFLDSQIEKASGLETLVFMKDAISQPTRSLASSFRMVRGLDEYE